MFIIHRRTVEANGKRDKVDAVYWILNERIYPTPSLYDIMANRTVRLSLVPLLRFHFLSSLLPYYITDTLEKRSFPTLRNILHTLSAPSPLEPANK